MHLPCTSHAPFMHPSSTLHAPFMHPSWTSHAPSMHQPQLGFIILVQKQIEIKYKKNTIAQNTLINLSYELCKLKYMIWRVLKASEMSDYEGVHAPDMDAACTRNAPDMHSTCTEIMHVCTILGAALDLTKSLSLDARVIFVATFNSVLDRQLELNVR